MVLRNLLRRRTRTLLTLVGISVSIAAVVALNSFADGFSRSFTTVLNSSGADVVVSQKDSPDILFSAIDSSVQPRIARVAGVRQVSGALVSFITLPGVPYFFVFGMDPDGFGIARYRVVEGRPLGGARQALLGRSAANTYHKLVGDYFKLQDVSFKIVGLYETGQGVEDSGAVISLSEAQQLFKRPGQVGYYQLKLDDPGMTERVIADLSARFPDLTASRTSNYADNLREVQMVRAIGYALTALAILAGGLGMMNTMLMTVFERTREIGMFRAVGWRRRRVMTMILKEAMLLTIPGGVAGCILGAVAVFVVNRGPIMSGFLDGTLTPALFVQALLVAVALGIVGGLYPAWRAAQLLPPGGHAL